MKIIGRLFTLAATSLLSGCGSLLFSLANAPSHFGTARRSADIPYGEHARQKLDVYAPRAAAGLPVVIFWYGGAWTAGDKANYRFVGTALADRGIITVIPDYRLYPAVKFPEFVDDGARAVAWVQQHVALFGGNPDRIVLMGHSAGAHEAALLAYEPRYLQRVGARHQSIVGFIGLSGPYQLIPNSKTLDTIFNAPYLPEDWQPVKHVNRSAPPTLLLHGLNDQIVTHEHANRLEAALQAHDVWVEKMLLPGRNHADTVASFASLARYRTPALAASVKFIGQVAQGKISSRKHPSVAAHGQPYASAVQRMP